MDGVSNKEILTKFKTKILLTLLFPDLYLNPRWYRRSLLLESDNNFLIERKGTLNTFIIRNVQNKHFGNYKCLASNSLGRETAEIKLTGRNLQRNIGL